MENEIKREGNENLKYLIIASASIGNVIAEVFEDGVLDWKDLKSMPRMMTAVNSITGVNFDEVIPEASEIDDEEMEELAISFTENFNIKNDSLEATIEEGLERLMQVVQNIKFFIDLAKKK